MYYILTKSTVEIFELEQAISIIQHLFVLKKTISGGRSQDMFQKCKPVQPSPPVRPCGQLQGRQNSRGRARLRRGVPEEEVLFKTSNFSLSISASQRKLGEGQSLKRSGLGQGGSQRRQPRVLEQRGRA